MSDNKVLEDYVISLVETCYRDPVLVARNNNIISQEDYRFCRKAPVVPAEFEKIATQFRSPFAFDIVRRAVGLISSAFPVPKRIPTSDTPEAQSFSSDVEKWLKEGYIVMDRRNHFWQRVIDSFCSIGCGVFTCVLDEQLWTAPRRMKNESAEDHLARISSHRKQTFPFFASHIPTETFYPFPDEYGLAEVIVITQDNASRLAHKYGLVYGDKGYGKKLVKPEEAKVTYDGYPPNAKFVQWWNRTEFCYMVDETIVKRGKHKYGRPPFFVAPLMSDSRYNHGEESYGLVWPMMNLQAIYDSMVTMDLNSQWLYSFPYLALEPTSVDAPPLQNVTIELRHDVPYTPPPGYKLVWMTPPINAASINMREQIKRVIDQISLAPILYGELGGGDIGSATASTMIAIGKSILAPGLNNLSSAFDELASFILKQSEILQAKYGDKIPLWIEDKTDKKGSWHYLDASKLKGYYEVRHSANPVLPMERWSKAMYIADAQARGGVSMRYYREEGIGIEDPEKMEDEVWVEDARKSTEYRSVLLQEWLLEHETMREEEKARLQGLLGGANTNAALPIGPGGPGVSMMPGIQQPMVSGGMMPARPGQPAPQAGAGKPNA